jgi:hypothetical protein
LPLFLVSIRSARRWPLFGTIADRSLQAGQANCCTAYDSIGLVTAAGRRVGLYYWGAAGAVLTTGCDYHFINQETTQRLSALVSAIELSSAAAGAKVGGSF